MVFHFTDLLEATDSCTQAMDYSAPISHACVLMLSLSTHLKEMAEFALECYPCCTGFAAQHVY